MRPSYLGAPRASQPDPVPRICALLGPRERTQVEAATDGRLSILHRATVIGICEDIAAGHADGAIISVALVREPDVPRLVTLVRDLPGTPVVGLVGEDGAAAAVPGSLLLGRAGVSRIVDVRDRTGWASLRDSFTLELPEGAVRSALAAIFAALEVEPDGTRSRCPEGLRQFFAAVFGPNATTALAIAADLGIIPSTLISRFVRAGLPSPKQYLALAKLVRAAYLGEAPGLTITVIAQRLQVSSPQSYCRMVRHMTGMTASEFRRAINGAAALDRFTAALITPYSNILRTFDPFRVRVRAAAAHQVAAGRAA